MGLKTQENLSAGTILSNGFLMRKLPWRIIMPPRYLDAALYGQGKSLMPPDVGHNGLLGGIMQPKIL